MQDSTILKNALAGGAAGAFTRLMLQPLDVLKIRFQLQLEPIKYGSKYSSLFQATKSIIKEEGPSALWSGHIPAQYLSITYGLLQFSTYEKCIQISQIYSSEQFFTHYHSINFVSGAIAATVATVVSFPFDTVRTRLVAEKKWTKTSYNGLFDVFSKMIKAEGPTSLFKGLVPTLAMIAPHTGIQFSIYKLFTHDLFNQISFFRRKNSNLQLSLFANLIAGAIAGIVSKTVIYPFDLIKKRLQIQGFQEHRSTFGRQIYCNGFFHCFRLTVKMEGFLALYKGFGPSLLKATMASGFHFAVYDEIKRILFKL